jgi:hypothetical protein
MSNNDEIIIPFKYPDPHGHYTHEQENHLVLTKADCFALFEKLHEWHWEWMKSNELKK